MAIFSRYIQSGFVWLAIVTVILGIFFRTTHIDQKVYWHDEVFTSIRASGYTAEEITPAVFSGIPLPSETLLQYQRLNPERNWGDTWRALTANPEHPPLYFLLARLWMQLFGSHVTVIRSLSVLFSLLAFPALYWLCQELFNTPAISWLTIGLFAVSPFFVLYAQEARQSSLWTLTTLLSTAALLRALRVQSWLSWALYAATVALNLYTFLLSVMVLLGHGVMVLRQRPFSWRSMQQFLLSSLIGVLTFTPWILVLIQHWLSFQVKTAWTNVSPSKLQLIQLWGLHFSSNFADFGTPLAHLYTYIVPPIVLLLLGYAGWILYRQASPQIWLPIFLLVGLPVLLLILPDILLGGQRSSHTRYFVPMLIGAQLAVAYLLNYLLYHTSGLHRQVGRGLLAVLLTAGILSCSLIWRAETWWNKGISYGNPAAAAVLNQLDRPVVISSLGDTTLGNVISLSHLVNDRVRFQLTIDPAVPEISNRGDSFLFYPTEALMQTLQAGGSFTIEPVEQSVLYPAQLLRIVDSSSP